MLNNQGQQLLDLCIASQLRILNGRYIGERLGNLTCYKANGASTVDYTLTNVDLINAVKKNSDFRPIIFVRSCSDFCAYQM